MTASGKMGSLTLGDSESAEKDSILGSASESRLRSALELRDGAASGDKLLQGGQ